jgi:phosphoribosylamine--glycine ligase
MGDLGILERMKILVIGGGGREHALVWKLAQDSVRPTLYCAPGNAGTASLAVNLPIAAEDLDGLLVWAQRERPDLTVVGPEVPLCAGLVDRLMEKGLRVFGPCQAAAELEGSKVFSKEIMQAAGVPTARSAVYTTADAALKGVRAMGVPLVIKAEGLAAGKGVAVCMSLDEAERAVRECLVDGVFGAAGKRLLVEEFLDGEEASVLAFVDGKQAVLMASAQDHKRIFDGDQGPNTGGMGAYSPAPVMTPAVLDDIRREVFDRTLTELRRRKIDYHGVLYAGIMMTAKGPRVLEFNCRFGDPETQVILPRLEGDLIPILNACIDGTLRPEMVRWSNEPCVCVVLAAAGYPGTIRKGDVINGLAAANALPGVVAFQAGTRKVGENVVTAGGRVLGVTARAADLPRTVQRVYEAVGLIHFDGLQYRRDIAARALNRVKG